MFAAGDTMSCTGAGKMIWIAVADEVALADKSEQQNSSSKVCAVTKLMEEEGKSGRKRRGLLSGIPRQQSNRNLKMTKVKGSRALPTLALVTSLIVETCE